MKPPEVTFQELCAATDLPAAIHELKPHALARLIAWLWDIGTGEDSVMALVLDLAVIEAARQFVKAHP